MSCCQPDPKIRLSGIIRTTMADNGRRQSTKRTAIVSPTALKYVKKNRIQNFNTAPYFTHIFHVIIQLCTSSADLLNQKRSVKHPHFLIATSLHSLRRAVVHHVVDLPCRRLSYLVTLIAISFSRQLHFSNVFLSCNSNSNSTLQNITP